MSMEQNKQHAFDAYCKRVVKNEAINILLEYDRQGRQEVSFSELSQRELQAVQGLQHIDHYAPDRRVFSVQNMSFEIRDSQLAQALSALTVKRRSIVLLAYLLDMKDEQIARRLQLSRSAVQRNRTSTLEELRKLLEGYEHE